MCSKNITRNAVGRVARLGDLYDARTDSFVGFSILNGSIPETAVDITKTPASTIDYINTENILEKFEKLNIIPELRASILADLVSFDGHGKFIENEAKNKKTRKTMIYLIQTEVEKLIFDKDLDQYFELDSLDLDFATHFVVGITWGANSIIVLEEKNENGDKRKSNDALKEELRTLCSSIYDEEPSISGDCGDNYLVKMFGDILPRTNLPKTVQEAKKMLKKLPRLVQMVNQGKGKPITYALMPIAKLDNCLNGTPIIEIITPLNEKEILNFTKVIDEINEAKLEINDVFCKFETHPYCVPIDKQQKLNQLKSEIEKQEMKLKIKFKDAIIAIRSGKLEPEALEKIFTNQSCEFLPDEVRVQLKEYDNLLEKIQLVQKLKSHDVMYIGSNNSIGLEEIKKLGKKLYIFFLRSDVKEFNNNLWDENIGYFFYLLNQSRATNIKTSFVAVDLDVRSDLAVTEKEDGAQICLLRNEKLVDINVYESHMRERFTCYARIYGLYENCPKPSKRIELKLKCPGSLKSLCGTTTQKWHCKMCKEPLSYGFDKYFYCSCGRANGKKFSFKCNDSRHGNFFITFKPQQLEELLKEIPPLEELNVLILGVTGVGKSTWVNAFLNYLAYPTLDEASKNELLSVTSSSFQLTDEDDTTHTIRFGHDENEVLEPGQSATQDVKAHLFPIGSTLLRLIDSPGIGDVRGVEQDKKNFKNILKYLSNLRWLNGICILLKPNESRLNVLFEFCVKELLTHLHKNATKNVVFCFTHSRETFYKPGDTRQPLGELLWKNQIELYLKKDTMYCMDNESFRFLCAANQGIEFRDSVKKSFSESWNISVEETNRLINHFKTLEPHIIDDTISLNDARQNIVCLTKPIADISKNIQQNLAIIKDKQEMLSSSKASEQDLMKMLHLDIIKLETEPLNHPRTVCGAAKCVEYHPAADGSIAAIEYVRHCHSHCYLEDVPVDIVGDIRLKGCAAMNGTLNCTQCGCCWDQHLHITYVQNRVNARITVQDVECRISGKISEREQIEAFIQKIEAIRIEQEDEQRKIIEVSVKLGRYLSKNAILAYNDVLGRYIDHLIEKEEHKVAIDGNDQLLKRLKAMKEMYEEELKALKIAMDQPNAEEINFNDFQRHLKELYALKHNGSQLQNAIEHASSSGKDTKKKNYETFHGSKRQTRGHGVHNNERFEACSQVGYAVVTKTGNDGSYLRKTLTWIQKKIWY